MAELIELSIEETNKLRAKIGLPLIPTETSGTKKKENEGLSVEDTNKLRVSLGLTPLVADVPNKNLLENRENVQTQNGYKASKNLEIQVQTKPKPPRVTFNYDDVDTDSWLDSLGGLNEKAPPLQKNTTKSQVVEDNSRTKVNHSTKQLAQLADGSIFTLADTGILDDSEDELVNETLTREAKVARDQKEREKEGFLKFGKPRFAGESGDESDDPESQLALIEGSTILLMQNPENKKQDEHAVPGHMTKIEGLFEDLEPLRPAVSMKKLKLKKSKSTSKKRKREEDDLIDSTEPMYTAQLEDDDNLEDNFEEILNRVRVKKNKTRKHMTAEEIAEEVKLHKRVDLATGVESGFVYDDTKDFLDAIGMVLEKKPDPIANLDTPVKDILEALSSPGKHEDSLEKKEIIQENHSDKTFSTTKDSTDNTSIEDREALETTHSNEPHLNSILSTLKYLRTKTSVLDAEGVRKSKAERERQREAELAKIQINIEDRLVRDEMKKDPSFLKMSSEEQEKIIDRILNERLVQKGIVVETGKRGSRYSRYNGPADPLKDYSPQVSVEYKDSRGNKLNHKQAWKELLHRYHGLAPKNKKEPAGSKSTEERVIH